MGVLAKGGEKGKTKETSPREHPRHSAKIPVQVDVVHAWKGSASVSLAGHLVDVSRGGAALRLDRVLPPRTRLRVAMATAIPGLHLVAEVVWTPLGPAGETPGQMYGLRWLEQLSKAQFEALMPLLAAPRADPPKPASKPRG